MELDLQSHFRIGWSRTKKKKRENIKIKTRRRPNSRFPTRERIDRMDLGLAGLTNREAGRQACMQACMYTARLCPAPRGFAKHGVRLMIR